MHFIFHRSYRGPLKAGLLDWAGTTMDYGCMAPAVVDDLADVAPLLVHLNARLAGGERPSLAEPNPTPRPAKPRTK